MKTKDEILQLWLDWVENNSSTVEAQGKMYCYYCLGRDYIYGKENHEDDCIYKLTKEYIETV